MVPTYCASLIIMVPKKNHHLPSQGCGFVQIPKIPKCTMIKATLCIFWHCYHQHNHCFVNLVNAWEMCCNTNYVDSCFITLVFPFCLLINCNKVSLTQIHVIVSNAAYARSQFVLVLHLFLLHPVFCLQCSVQSSAGVCPESSINQSVAS